MPISGEWNEDGVFRGSVTPPAHRLPDGRVACPVCEAVEPIGCPRCEGEGYVVVRRDGTPVTASTLPIEGPAIGGKTDDSAGVDGSAG